MVKAIEKMNVGLLIPIYMVGSLILTGIALFCLYPWHPVTWIGWLTLYLSAPPVMALLEFLGEKVLSRELGENVDPELSQISGGRIIVATILGVVWVTAILGAFYFIADGPIEFFQNHFSNEW